MCKVGVCRDASHTRSFFFFLFVAALVELFFDILLVGNVKIIGFTGVPMPILFFDTGVAYHFSVKVDLTWGDKKR